MNVRAPAPAPRRRRRLPHRYHAIAMPLVLSGLMTLVVSGISTVKVLGLGPGVVSAWMSAWGLSWLVAFPTLVAILPVVRRIVALLVEPAPR